MKSVKGNQYTNRNISTDERTHRYPECIYNPLHGYLWHALPGGCYFRCPLAIGRLADRLPVLAQAIARS